MSNNEVGQLVLVTNYYGRKISKIEHITPSGLIRIDNELYNKNGNLRGSQGFNKPFFKVISDVEASALMEEFQLAKLIRKIKRFDFSDIDLKTVIEIVDLLERVDNDE